MGIQIRFVFLVVLVMVLVGLGIAETPPSSGMEPFGLW